MRIEKEIKNYLDPSKENLRNFTDTHAIFLGFEQVILREFENEYSGEVLYNPRKCIEGLNKWAVDWLNEHLEWPAILELD